MAFTGTIPTVASLARIKGASKDRAKVVRAALEAAAKTTSRGSVLLDTADRLIGGHGVENLYPDHGNIYYVNLGDPYDTTLMYDSRKGRLYVGAWGDYVERHG